MVETQLRRFVFLFHRFDTEDEALAVANASDVGLAGESVPLSSGREELQKRKWTLIEPDTFILKV